MSRILNMLKKWRYKGLPIRPLIFRNLLILLPLSFGVSRPPDLISLSVGVFDFMRHRHRTCEFSFEYQFQLPSPTEWVLFRPITGAMVTARGANYFYGGINFDFIFYKIIVISPGIAAGWYNACGGKNLGFPLEFRSCLEIAWQRPNFQRLGTRISHMSNASFGKRNPGEESLVIFYSVPIN